MKEVFIGSTVVIVTALAIASYAGEKLASPNQNPSILPTQILKH